MASQTISINNADDAHTEYWLESRLGRGKGYQVAGKLPGTQRRLGRRCRSALHSRFPEGGNIII